MTPTTRLITGTELRERLGLCRTAFHTRRALGKIGPKPVTTLGHPRWSDEEITAWLTHRDAEGELYDVARWPAVWKRLQQGK